MVVCSAVFFVSFRKTMMKNFLHFLEFSFVLATQTNSKSSEDVLPIIEPKWFFEKCSRKTKGCLHDTGAIFVPWRVHSGSLSWLYICLHDTTTKSHAGVSRPGVSSLWLSHRVRISLQYEISQRYHVNTKQPPVSVWNRSAGRLERVVHA